MSILSAVHAYLASYAGLKEGAPLWVDFLGPMPTEYSIVPQPGAKIVETDITGKSTRVFPFAFQSTESTADNQSRIDIGEFYEALSDWFESQTEAEILPDLGPKKKAVSIEALSWAFMIEQGQSDTGIYQIQCRLTYEQVP